MALTEKLSEITAAEDFQKYFAEVADILLNKGKLIINGTEYRLTEIEFYFNNKEKHNDTFAHCNAEQLNNGTWYFHPSGIDITFGSKENDIYGGILLRAITLASNTDEKKNMENDVYGPLKMRALLGSKLEDLRKFQGMMCTETEDIFWIDDEAAFEEQTIYSVPRFGLNPKNDKDEKFINKPYRFIIYPMKEHKGKESIIAKYWNNPELFKKVFGYKLLKKN